MESCVNRETMNDLGCAINSLSRAWENILTDLKKKKKETRALKSVRKIIRERGREKEDKEMIR